MDKRKPRVILKRDLKHFNEQAFYHDLSNCKWNRIDLIPDVETAWSFFYDCFMAIVNKHATFKKFRIKGRDNPWFTPDLANALHERNLVWTKARKTGLKCDWDNFRKLRNKSSSQIKNAKSTFYLSTTTDSLNDPKRFWKTIKSLTVENNSQVLPNYIVHNSSNIYDKVEMVNCFNQHFILSTPSINSSNTVTVPEQPSYASTFSFQPFTLCQVRKALQSLDARKPQGPDLIDPYFLKIAADLIAKPLTDIFNLSLTTMQIPKIWKSAFVTPLFKGGDPKIVNNYRPVSKLCILSKILESLINEQLK